MYNIEHRQAQISFTSMSFCLTEIEEQQKADNKLLVLEPDTTVGSWLLILFLQPQDAPIKTFGKCICHTLPHPLFSILLSLFSVILI